MQSPYFFEQPMHTATINPAFTPALAEFSDKIFVVGNTYYAVTRPGVRAGTGPRRVTVDELIHAEQNGQQHVLGVRCGRGLFGPGELYESVGDAILATQNVVAEERAKLLSDYEAKTRNLTSVLSECVALAASVASNTEPAKLSPIPEIAVAQGITTIPSPTERDLYMVYDFDTAVHLATACAMAGVRAKAVQFKGASYVVGPNSSPTTAP